MVHSTNFYSFKLNEIPVLEIHRNKDKNLNSHVDSIKNIFFLTSCIEIASFCWASYLVNRSFVSQWSLMPLKKFCNAQLKVLAFSNLILYPLSLLNRVSKSLKSVWLEYPFSRKFLVGLHLQKDYIFKRELIMCCINFPKAEYFNLPLLRYKVSR